MWTMSQKLVKTESQDIGYVPFILSMKTSKDWDLVK
jgi:hypothetical protein